MMHESLTPSRKDTIMLMTIIGWAACGICSIVAYYMAKEDLAQMDAGLMDDRDRSSVQLMKTVGLVHIGLMSVSLFFACCMIMMSVGSAGTGGY
jgi:hypothetical protein